MISESLDPADLFTVKGLVAVVTGGGTGIGLMIAKALEANGATVYVVGRRQEVLSKAAEQAKHGNIIPLRGDVTSKTDLSRIINTISERSGYINVLVANSGITGPSIHDIPANASLSEFASHLWNSDIDDFNRTYMVNTSAVFFTIAGFLDLLGKGNEKGNVKQSSQVIATSSIGAFNRVPLAGYAYGSSKAAVTHMMKQFATNLAKYKIRSNIIAPGLYPSEMTAHYFKEMNEKGWSKDFIPEERAGTIEDMAGAILFLASKAGAYVNGNVLITDGGRLSIIPATY
ncbi:NAD(P)-binding protein [Lojkania enalia]|uniref:NAD(P)-binding protein n=1 Tax=Lojkania enalia TaxID=147567 RepID=A0A9P4KBD7_9PLEO|nr:NAD(P)-binding protein [Didymosphaeria enalia]